MRNKHAIYFSAFLSCVSEYLLNIYSKFDFEKSKKYVGGFKKIKK